MNGRMYDPVIGRVLSPDNYVQDPTNTQCYNRYSYCLNNPLRYTDPSGWLTEAAWADVSRAWNNMVSDPENFVNGTYSWSSGSRNDIGGTGDIFTYSSSEDFMLSTLIDYNNQYSSWGNTTLSSAFGKSSAVDNLKIKWVLWAGTPSNPYQWLTGVRLQNGTFISKFYDGGDNAALVNNGFSKGNGETPWMSFAISQLGVSEATGNNDGPEVAKYLETVGLTPGPKSYWCGAFVNWSMTQIGITGPKHPARALEWRNFGQTLANPAYGSIGTFKRPGGGHVGFVVGIDQNRPGWVIMLGGNQQDGVRYNSFPISIMQFNYPNGFIPSYTLPSMGGIPKGVRMQ